MTAPDRTGRARRRLRLAGDALVVLGAVVLSASLLRMFVLDSFRIPTGSMEPTLLPGDAVLVSKLAYGAHSPGFLSWLGIPTFRLPPLARVRRGDVVAARVSDPYGDAGRADRVVLKRCVALPGDAVSFMGEEVRVNDPGAGIGSVQVPGRGTILHLRPETIDAVRGLIASEGHEVSVTEAGEILVDGAASASYAVQHDYVYLLGDNRQGSRDSRDWGPVREDALIGRVALITWSADGGGVRWARIGTMVR